MSKKQDEKKPLNELQFTALKRKFKGTGSDDQESVLSARVTSTRSCPPRILQSRLQTRVRKSFLKPRPLPEQANNEEVNSSISPKNEEKVPDVTSDDYYEYRKLTPQHHHLSKDIESSHRTIPNHPIDSNSHPYTRLKSEILLSKEPVKNIKKREKTASKAKLNLCTGTVLFMIVLAFGSSFISSFIGSVDQPVKIETPHILKLYQKSLVDIKKEFPLQDDELWNVVKIALEPHLTSTGQPKPAVLLLASDEESTPTAECLAQKLSSAFSSSCEVKDAKVYGSNLNPGTAKMDLDKLITSKFKKGTCSVVVSRIELIPTHAITVFYQFCEDDNAPFKEAAILLTLQVDFNEWGKEYKKLWRLPPKLWDSVVSDYLTYSLQSRDPGFMPDSYIENVLSCLTSSVIWVNKETNIPC